jgi:hypothetical protein
MRHQQIDAWYIYEDVICVLILSVCFLAFGFWFFFGCLLLFWLLVLD